VLAIIIGRIVRKARDQVFDHGFYRRTGFCVSTLRKKVIGDEWSLF